MTTEPTVPAILYAAKSTQDTRASIPTQLENGREKAAEEGWEVGGEFWDEGFSAYSRNRGPGLKKAEVAAEKAAADYGTVAMLVVQHSDRLARGAGDEPGASDSLVEVWSRLRRKHVHVRSFQNDSMMGDVVLVAVAGKQANEESERKSKATKDGLERRRAKGKYLGKRSLGYRFKRLSLDDEEQTMVIDPAEAATVKRIYGAFRAGHAQARIARDLTTDGLHATEGGTEWYQGGVRRILQNPVYAGLVRDGGELIEGVHEAIIPRTEWQEVQDLLGRKAVVYNRGRAPVGLHLFRNAHLRCGECGAPMVPRTEGPRQTYRCNRRNRNSAACGQAEIRRADVDSAVFAYFADVALDITATRKGMQEARDQKLAEVGALLNAAEREAVEAADAITRIERDYSRGKLDVDEWRRWATKLTPELEAAEAERDRLREQQAQVEAGAAHLDAEAEVIEDLARIRNAVAGRVDEAADVEAVRAALVRQFKEFILHREGMTAACRPEGQDWEPLEPDCTDVPLDDDKDGMRWIEPVPNWDSIEGFDADLRPVLKRKPLGQAPNNYALSRVSA